MPPDFSVPPKLSPGDRVAVVSAAYAAPADFPAVHEQGMRRLNGTSLHADDRTIELGGSAEGLKVAEAAGSLAVTSPFSHFVRIFPKVLA